MRVTHYLRLLIFFLFLIVGIEANFAALPVAVSQELAKVGISEDSIAFVVQPVSDGTPSFAHQADKAMNPASVMKLVTTYAALQILGPAYTWKTEALIDGNVRQGVLHGNLFIKGYGDPKLTVDQFWLFLKRIRAAGIKKINGDVLLDNTYFLSNLQDPNDFDGKSWRAYNVIPNALLINFNSINLNVSADPVTQTVKVWTEPDFKALQVINRIKLDSEPCVEWRDRLSLKKENYSRTIKLTLSGNFSVYCGDKTYSVSLFTASDFAEVLFLDLWDSVQGKLRGHVRVGEVSPNAVVVARFNSPPLSTVIGDINKWSNNVMARHLYLTLGATGNPPATSDKSILVIQQWLIDKNMNFPELVLENGSGLSRLERISAFHLNDLLIDAWKSPVMPEFIASLPIVAMDGTMRSRLKQNDIVGRAHIKTGSLDEVKTLAGYVLDKHGHWISVVSFINHPHANAARSAEDALLNWIYNGRE